MAAAFPNQVQRDERYQSELQRLALPSWVQGDRQVSSSGGNLCLRLPCFASENLHQYKRAKETGHPEGWPEVSWTTAEVIFDRHGEPFDAEAAVRQGIVNYHQNGDGGDNE